MFLTTKKLLIFIFIFSCIFTVVAPALAQYGLEETGKAAEIPSGLREATPATLIGQIIGVALGLVGVIFLALMVYGGFLWMTARGNEQQVKQATELIIAAFVGMLIVAAAYVITNFVIDALVT
ncbi:MAG: hypothetical protein U9P90_03795 [Patescibacteria group bacterium]|nr:hypothetical protein [Patescibacteria group bacterium]